jgi:hypothetical protein
MTHLDFAALSAAGDRLIDTGNALKAAIVEDAPPPAEIVPPVAFGDAVAVTVGESITLDLVANDQPGSAPILGARITQAPAHVTTSVDGGRVTVNAGLQALADSFSYVAEAQDGAVSAPATVAVTVLAKAPPPPPPPAPHALQLRGYHPANGQLKGDAGPVDIFGSTQRIKDGLQPKRWPDIVGLWPGRQSSKLLLPGKGLPADIYQRLTDNGAVALLSLPVCWSDNPGDFAGVAAGKYDQLWADHLGWALRQGQDRIRVRITEPNRPRSFPYGVGYSQEPDYSDIREAFAHFFKVVGKVAPNAMRIMSWFKQGFTLKTDGSKPNIHPDDIAPPKETYEADTVDWYDGDGQPVSSANVDQVMAQQVGLPDGRKAPRGADAWESYANGRGHYFGICESGIVCPAGSPPERDNPFFIDALEQRARSKWRRVAHLVYFHPHSDEHKILGGTNIGSRKTTDKFMQLYNVAELQR